MITLRVFFFWSFLRNHPQGSQTQFCQFYAACCWNNPFTSTCWECSLTPWPPVPSCNACEVPLWLTPHHGRVFNTLSENLLHFSLQGPLVAVRTIWRWKSTEQLMLPERCLEWRKCFSELLSKMISLWTAQYSTSELNTHHYPFCQCITWKIYFVFCLKAMKLNTVFFCLFVFFAARAAEKQSEWIRPSKGLPQRAPFPPGHILHYPENDSHVCAHANIHTYTHTNSENRNFLSPIRCCQVNFLPDMIMTSSAL